MEKLITLLNEFDEFYYGENAANWRYDYGFYRGVDKNYCADSHIISKQFGFIKRLVDNDKIDFKEMYEKIGKPQIVMYDERYNEEELCEGKQISERDYYEDVLMILAIQDEPIEFLVDMLR